MKEVTRAGFLRVVTVVAGGALFGCASDETPAESDDSGAGGAGQGASPPVGGAGGAPGNGGAGGSPASCAMTIDAQITCREGHSLVIPVEDLMAAQTKTYDIRGTNNTHGHMVTVTADQFAQLLAGGTVEIYVPSQVLPHTVFIKCEGLDPAELDLVDC